MSLNLSRKKIIFFAVCLVFGMVCVAFLACFAHYLQSPAEKDASDQVFFVLEGSTLSAVADELETKKIIKNKFIFLVWAKLTGHARNIKTGEYLLNPNMTPLYILNMLSQGDVVLHSITIPEGYSRMQIGELLAQKGFVDKNEFLTITGDPDNAGRYGILGPDLEGYLYPDTYQFDRGLSAASIVDVMVGHFKEVIAPFKERIKESNLTMEQVVILASIVEKETGCAEERPVIASVFLNRLKKKNRLESDPTVIYGIKNFNGNLKKKDLSTFTPYNTYVIRGLPPGAIANPGIEALKAVLYPADTSYIFFVSKNDGRHHFSKTLSEHNRAVRIYQKSRRSRQKAKGR